MKIGKRVLSYFILFLIHLIIIIGYIFISISITEHSIIDVLLLILPINIIYSRFLLARGWLVNILLSIGILSINYLISESIYRNNWYPSGDAYAIKTTIACICLSPVFLWEIVYHINKKIPTRHNV